MYRLRIEISETEQLDVGKVGDIMLTQKPMVTLSADLKDPRDFSHQLRAIAEMLEEWES